MHRARSMEGLFTGGPTGYASISSSGCGTGSSGPSLGSSTGGLGPNSGLAPDVAIRPVDTVFPGPPVTSSPVPRRIVPEPGRQVRLGTHECPMLDIVNLPPDTPARPDGSRVGGWWHAPDDGRIVCDLCPRALLAQGRRQGLLLRPGERRRPDGPDDLRQEHRLLHRPDREEAAGPLLSRHQRPVVRHRRLQPRLQVLPELVDLQVARRSRRCPSTPRPSRSPIGGRVARLQERGVHLQRPGASGPSTPSTRPGPAGSGASRRSPSPPATSRPRPAGRSSR